MLDTRPITNRFIQITNRSIETSLQTQIEDNPPNGFQPVQVIFRELIIEADGAYRYIAIDKPTPITAQFSIEQFALDIINDGYHRNDTDHEELKYLDITVSKQSYIIIQLSGQFSWKYSTRFPALALGPRETGQPDPNDIYGELRHVSDLGVISPDPLNDCRLAYFSAMPVPGTVKQPYLRSLNFNTERRGGTQTIIDPDIRNPGNGGS